MFNHMKQKGNKMRIIFKLMNTTDTVFSPKTIFFLKAKVYTIPCTLKKKLPLHTETHRQM